MSLNSFFSEEEINKRLLDSKNRKLRVFYGIAKLGKIRKKKAIQVIFENSDHNPLSYEDKVKRFIDIAYVRYQTEGERLGSAYSHKIFTSYSLFIDDNFKGDWKAALHANYLDDRYNVCKDERILIKEKLTNALRRNYSFDIPYQSSFEFE